MDKKTIAKTTTLEKIISGMGAGFNEDKVHAAMLLSFAQSVYGTIGKDCVPSPVYIVSYDKRNNNIKMKESQGYSEVPKKGELTISLLDILFMSNLRDIPILCEGETGVGKTFAFQRYFSTILKPENYFSYRLSGNAFVNNLFQHFQEGKMANGIPVIEARKDRIEATAGGIVDEINRGDPNETLQLFDNEMHLGGTIHKLGIPIPEIKNNVYSPDGGKKKKMVLFSAQNPASSDDAKFTGTMQLDAAVDNRLLKIYVSNSAASAGSTLWLGSGQKKRHQAFLEKFKEKASDYLGIRRDIFSGIEEDWLFTYAWLTDPSKTDKPILYSALELADLMTAIFGGNPTSYFDYEKQVLADWDSELEKKVKITENLQETESVKKIKEVVNSFKVPVIFRDIVQIKKNADVISTLKNIKDALKTQDPIKTYLAARKYVTVREVAESTALVARNKQRPESPSSVNAINEILTKYCTLCEEYMKELTKFGATFDIYDPQAGIKYPAIAKSIKENIIAKGDVDKLIDRIAGEAKKLAGKISISEPVRNIILARSCSDLMTLCGFLNEYSKEIEPILKKYRNANETERVIEEFGKLYFVKHRDLAIVMPDIYQHRIQRTLGIENE
jgi:hypothetical protein